jgi:hypothetical protein
MHSFPHKYWPVIIGKGVHRSEGLMIILGLV